MTGTGKYLVVLRLPLLVILRLHTGHIRGRRLLILSRG